MTSAPSRVTPCGIVRRVKAVHRLLTVVGTLLLLNHWITDKQREVSNATRVECPRRVAARAEQCRDERGLLPNYVAVDFYDRGDLFGVVDTLNGVG